VKLRLCSSKNTSNLLLGIFSCSNPVPLRAHLPHSKGGGARAPPGYMAPVPLD